MQAINLYDELKGNLNSLLYGEPGCGKTYFGATVGEENYTLYIDQDRGIKTAVQLPKKITDNLVIIRWDTIKDIDATYKALLKNDPAEMSRIFQQPVKKPFEACVIDTYSSVNQFIIEGKRIEIGKAGNSLSSFRKSIEIQDWGAINDYSILVIDAFTSLRMHTVFLMHEQYYQDEKIGFVKGTPSHSGKLAPEIAKYFDIAGHMTINLAGKFITDFAPKQRWQGKTRLKMDKTIENLTFKDLCRQIQQNAVLNK